MTTPSPTHARPSTAARPFTGARASGARLDIVDLGHGLHQAIPTSPSHPGYRHALMRRHGDAVRVDGTSGANDLLVLGTHTGTHVDALAHISADGLLHGGVDAEAAQRTGRFTEHGVEEVAPAIVPGVLLDVPRAVGVDRLGASHPVSAADLDAAAALLPGGAEDIPEGAALLVRTGWGQLWDEGPTFVGHESGVPGPNLDGGEWLAARRPRFVGSDTTAFEHIPAGEGHARLPVHRLMLVERGIPIIEMLSLESLAARGGLVFDFVISPLPLLGATGSPVRPLAVFEVHA
ncbi:cyclase family protein [Microbacterium gallinarum]|uniref:Cyclase family protein n=1 Tax=Microbacterium gallinarum TaxID=2762209 RepID=A0ABR8X076_9MICO|nr:cyclase family protein [Microbacterium gallinarum]MBD8022741.1 cyclase family protein [Microbacterium gallinarum]